MHKKLLIIKFYGEYCLKLDLQKKVSIYLVPDYERRCCLYHEN